MHGLIVYITKSSSSPSHRHHHQKVAPRRHLLDHMRAPSSISIGAGGVVHTTIATTTHRSVTSKSRGRTTKHPLPLRDVLLVVLPSLQFVLIHVLLGHHHVLFLFHHEFFPYLCLFELDHPLLQVGLALCFNFCKLDLFLLLGDKKLRLQCLRCQFLSCLHHVLHLLP